MSARGLNGRAKDLARRILERDRVRWIELELKRGMITIDEARQKLGLKKLDRA